MTTINISLPSKLKAKGDRYVKKGYYASFSDLTRSALRKELNKVDNEFWADQAERDYKEGRSVVLENSNDIKKYVESIMKKSENNHK